MKKPFYTIWSFWSLIIWNLVSIVWALKEDWSLNFIMAVYLIQGCIIGFFWFLRICALQDFYVTDRPEMSMKEAFQERSTAAVTFLVLYSLCHFQLFQWLVGKEISSIIGWPMLIMAGTFFLSECFSFFTGHIWVGEGRPTSAIIFFPYVRILPLYIPLMIVKICFVKEELLVVFLLFKTFADAFMYVVEYECFGDSSYPVIFLPKPKIEKSEECEFCRRAIGKSETPWVIKEHIVCKECYQKIKMEKQKTS